MKTLSAMASIGLLGGVLLLGGCANKELDEANARNRNAQEALKALQAAYEQMRAKNDQLQGELQQRDATIVSLQTKLADMEKARNAMLASIAGLKDELARLKGTPIVGPIGIGPLPAGLNKMLKKLADDNPTLLEFNEQLGMVKFKSDMTFAPGSDEVNADAKAALAKLAEILNTAEAKPFNVYIAGHTDDMPIVKPETKRRHPTNWYLSVHRAVAVEEVMAAASLDGSRLGAMGFGEFHPVAENPPNHKGNQANRRVEIWIVPPERFMTTTGAKIVEEPKPE